MYMFYDGFIAGLVVRGGREVKGVGAAIRGGGEGCYEGMRGGLGGGEIGTNGEVGLGVVGGRMVREGWVLSGLAVLLCDGAILCDLDED